MAGQTCPGCMTVRQWAVFLREVRDHTDPDGSLHGRTVRERYAERVRSHVVRGADLEKAEAAFTVFRKRWEALSDPERAIALKEAHR